MKINTKRSVNDELNKYDYLAKANEFIEITEWTNGEGINIQINDRPIISITHGELEAINYLINSLKYEKV